MALLNLAAVCQMRLGRPEQAMVCWQRALHLRPDYADVHNNLGALLQEQHRLEEAEAAYRQALRLQPGYADAHNNLGTLLWEQHRLEEAEAAFRQTLALRPDHANAWYNLGHLLQEQQCLEEAEAAYRHALRLRPDYTDAHNNLGNLLREQHRMEEAEVAFRDALQICPDYANAWYNLGGLLQEQHRLEEAEAAYRRALAINPALSAGRHLLAAVRGEKGAGIPERYIEDLFNAYADSFEHTLLEKLQYTMPVRLRQLVNRVAGERAFFPRAVDLGCGTGLVGQSFRPLCGHLLGIDLSRNMLEQAEKKSLYDQLVQGEMVAVLQQMAEGVDLFLAADVLVYTGDLDPLFAVIREKGKPGALFAFSVEHLDAGDYALRSTGRYAHASDHIHALAAANRFAVQTCERGVLRIEEGEAIDGVAYVLQCGTSGNSGSTT